MSHSKTAHWYGSLIDTNTESTEADRSPNRVHSLRLSSMREIGAELDKALREVLGEMKNLHHSFYQSFPVMIGQKGAYGLVLITCTKNGCPMCPHGLVWKRYDYLRFNPVLDAPEVYTRDLTAGDLSRASFQKSMPVVFERSARPRKSQRSKAAFIWREKKYGYLPPAFMKQMKNKAYYGQLQHFDSEMKRLNKCRKKLGQMRVTVQGFLRALQTSKAFKKE